MQLSFDCIVTVNKSGFHRPGDPKIPFQVEPGPCVPPRPGGPASLPAPSPPGVLYHSLPASQQVRYNLALARHSPTIYWYICCIVPCTLVIHHTLPYCHPLHGQRPYFCIIFTFPLVTPTLPTSSIQSHPNYPW